MRELPANIDVIKAELTEADMKSLEEDAEDVSDEIYRLIAGGEMRKRRSASRGTRDAGWQLCIFGKWKCNKRERMNL